MLECAFENCLNPAVEFVRTVRACLCEGTESATFPACGEHPARAPKAVVCPSCGVKDYGYIIPVGVAAGGAADRT